MTIFREFGQTLAWRCSMSDFRTGPRIACLALIMGCAGVWLFEVDAMARTATTGDTASKSSACCVNRLGPCCCRGSSRALTPGGFGHDQTQIASEFRVTETSAGKCECGSDEQPPAVPGKPVSTLDRNRCEPVANASSAGTGLSTRGRAFFAITARPAHPSSPIYLLCARLLI